MEIKNTLRLYNTLSRDIEDFVPVEDTIVRLYACGPTVYDYSHIGHIRKYVLDDVLVRLLRYLDYQVTHVMNITDVGHLVSDADTGEDKMEKGARKLGKTAWEVAKFFEKYFFKTMAAVDVKKPDIVCRATEHIQEQIALVSELEKKGFTYTISDGVYFDSTKFADYGKLARLDIAGLQAGARVEPVEGKKHPTDFALWKFTSQGQPFDSAQGKKRDMEWDSPWSFNKAQDKSKGFPGWHIECSAMSLKYLGNAFTDHTFHAENVRTIDLHTGGIDHIPVHHTNEIAQSEAATGKKFVNVWVHHNHLFVDGKKMSKSLGNFFTIDDIEKKGFSPHALRYLFLQTHYRQESNFTWDALSAAEKTLASLHNQVRVIAQQAKAGERTTLSSEKLEKVNLLRKRFKDVIRLDLNTAQALSVVWEMIKSNVPANDKYDLLMIADQILGLGLEQAAKIETVTQEIPEDIALLLKQRDEARAQKNWSESDRLRGELEQKGWVIEDGPTGSTVVKRG